MADEPIPIKAKRVIDEIVRRLNAGEPVTNELLAQLPPDSNVTMDVTVHNTDGSSHLCAVSITNDCEHGPRVDVGPARQRITH